MALARLEGRGLAFVAMRLDGYPIRHGISEPAMNVICALLRKRFAASVGLAQTPATRGTRNGEDES